MHAHAVRNFAETTRSYLTTRNVIQTSKKYEQTVTFLVKELNQFKKTQRLLI